MDDVRAYVLLSGGKDSLSVAYWMAERDMLKGCIALETGIAIPEWRDFIETTCSQRNWPLEVFAASKGPYGSWPVYEGLVKHLGFPGAKMHTVFMNWLKGRGVDEFKKVHPGELLVSGVRTGESVRRMHSAKRWSVFGRSPVWAPLLDWSTEKTWEYFMSTKMERSPGYLTLGISGDCLCGAFARPKEKEIISVEYPKLFSRIETLEHELQKLPIAEEHPNRCKWGWANSSKRKTLPSTICVECVPSETLEVCRVAKELKDK